MKPCRLLLVCILALMLTACRVELYSGLTEQDANQMLAVLMQHCIDAEKTAGDHGITLQVEKAQFVNAVEVLAMNGFPRKQFVTVDSMFPPGQLVESPAEEQQKILFLKEQRVENMLSKMDGVISAVVTIAGSGADGSSPGEVFSVAVFIKYSPQINLQAFRPQIIRLVTGAVPGVLPEKIDLLMQPAELRLSPQKVVVPDTTDRIRLWMYVYRWYFLLAGGGALMIALILCFVYIRTERV